MTRDDIIRMARKACDTDKVDAWHNGFWTVTQQELERFAALVAASEREACAKVCEEKEAWYWHAFKRGEPGTDLRGNTFAEGASQGAGESANAIRARGESK